MNGITPRQMDIIAIPLLAATAAAGLVINNLPPFSWYPLALITAGAIAYFAYVRITDFLPGFSCDFIQTGEGAAGALAIFTAAVLLNGGRNLLAACAFAAVLACNTYLHAATAPRPGEQASGGLLFQAVAAVIAAFLVGGDPSRAVRLQGALLGTLHLLPADFTIPGIAFGAGIAALALPLFAGPALRLHAQGRDFSHAPLLVHGAVTAALITARSLLLALTLMCAGWICCIGMAFRRTYPGRHRLTATLPAIIAVSQVVIIAGPLHALAVSYLISYAAFLFQMIGRAPLYDRN